MGTCYHTSICECGALDQTAAHVILDCPLHRALEDIVDCWSWMIKLDADSTTSSPTSEEDFSQQKGIKSYFHITTSLLIPNPDDDF